MDQGWVALAVMTAVALLPGVPPLFAGRWGVAFVAATTGIALVAYAATGGVWIAIAAWLALFVASCLYAGKAKRGDRRHAELIAASRAR